MLGLLNLILEQQKKEDNKYKEYTLYSCPQVYYRDKPYNTMPATASANSREIHISDRNS